MELKAGPSLVWKQFEKIVIRLLAKQGFSIQIHSPQGRDGYDLDGTLGEIRWAIEVKYYRSARAQTTLIEAAASRVANNGLMSGVHRAALVVSCLLTPEQRTSLEDKFQIAFIDRSDLSVMAAEQPELVDELESVLEGRVDVAEESKLEAGVKVRFDNAKHINADTPTSKRGQELAERLKSLPPGRDDAKNYELLCMDILKFLFGNYLVGWHPQLSTDDELNRFDSVCRVKPIHEFWRFVIDDLGSRYVVFEFKNYKEEISQGQILTTEKYLLERGLRRVAFLLTRVGADEGAQKMAKGAMREHGKLMLILDDALVEQMLLKRDDGNDPADILFDIADEFMLTLSR